MNSSFPNSTFGVLRAIKDISHISGTEKQKYEYQKVITFSGQYE